MQGSSEQPLVGEEHCVTTLITAAKETSKMAGAKSRHIENRGGTGKEGARCMWPFLLECILQNMVRHFVTHKRKVVNRSTDRRIW